MGVAPCGPGEGKYIKIGSDVFGLLSTAEGPILFFNQDRYSLHEHCWDVELVIGPRTHLFIFYWKGEVKISFRYNRRHDFFLWLHGQLSRELQAQRQVYA